MGNFRPFQSVVRSAVVAATLAVATSAEAQVSPKFFLDTFDDMNAQDEMPVSWSAWQGIGSIDAARGDLVVTAAQGPFDGSWIFVDDYIYDDISIRTQLAVTPDKPWAEANVYARGTGDSVYAAGITSSTHSWRPDSLWIWAFFSATEYQDLRYVHTDLDPAETDILLQFDLLGDQLTFTAWEAGTPKESGQRISVRNNRIQRGSLGITYWDRPPLAPPLPDYARATYRFYEAAEIRPGDFNVNDVLDVEDIDLLSLEIRLGRYRPQFNLNDDEFVNLTDHAIWVHELKHTWYGDADLNGEFNSNDMVQVFQAGKYEIGWVSHRASSIIAPTGPKATGTPTACSTAPTWLRHLLMAGMSRDRDRMWRRCRSRGRGRCWCWAWVSRGSVGGVGNPSEGRWRHRVCRRIGSLAGTDL